MKVRLAVCPQCRAQRESSDGRCIECEEEILDLTFVSLDELPVSAIEYLEREGVV